MADPDRAQDTSTEERPEKDTEVLEDSGENSNNSGSDDATATQEGQTGESPSQGNEHPAEKSDDETNIPDETSSLDSETEQQTRKDDSDQLTQIESELTTLGESIEQLRKRTDELETTIEDYERRNKREHKELKEYAVEDLAREMLKVKDNLQNAIEMEDLEEGTERRLRMVSRQFDKILTSENIDRIEPDPGDEFDDQLHRMVDREPTESYERDRIVRLLETGYVISDRIIRPARVVVAD